MVVLHSGPLGTLGSCPQTRLLGPEAACKIAPCPLLVAWLQPSLVLHSCAVASCCLQKRISQMLHLGAYFWLRLKKATYELDGLFESFLLYHYHQHSPMRCDRNLPSQKAGLSWVLYWPGYTVSRDYSRSTEQPITSGRDLSGSMVIVYR